MKRRQVWTVTSCSQPAYSSEWMNEWIIKCSAFVCVGNLYSPFTTTTTITSTTQQQTMTQWPKKVSHLYPYLRLLRIVCYVMLCYGVILKVLPWFVDRVGWVRRIAQSLRNDLLIKILPHSLFVHDFYIAIYVYHYCWNWSWTVPSYVRRLTA